MVREYDVRHYLDLLCLWYNETCPIRHTPGNKVLSEYTVCRDKQWKYEIENENEGRNNQWNGLNKCRMKQFLLYYDLTLNLFCKSSDLKFFPFSFTNLQNFIRRIWSVDCSVFGSCNYWLLTRSRRTLRVNHIDWKTPMVGRLLSRVWYTVNLENTFIELSERDKLIHFLLK